MLYTYIGYIYIFTYLANAYQGKEVKMRSRGEKTSRKTLCTKSYLQEFISFRHKLKLYNYYIFQHNFEDLRYFKQDNKISNKEGLQSLILY